MTSPRPETLNRLTDIVFDKVMRTLRTPDKNAPLYELLSEMMTRLDSELDLPLRLSATIPSSTKLLIKSNRVLSGDGGQRSLPPDGLDFNLFPDATIDWNNGSVSGGTVRRDGGTFSVPNVTVGQFIRVGFSYSATDNWVDTTFSSAAASLSGLIDPGSLLDALTGTKVGYIDLESDGVSSFKTPNALSGYIENSVSGVPYIFRFLSGGSGGGSGDASTLRTRLENQLQESIFNLLTPVDFAVDLDAFVDPSGTGTYNGGAFNFAVSGETYVSTALFDEDEFLANPSIPGQVDLSVFWSPDAIDAAADYEMSRNGGGYWQMVSGMERVGEATNAFTGNLVFDGGETNAVLETNAAAQTSGYELNTTGQTTYQDDFTLIDASVLRSLDLLSVTKTGSPLGSLFVDITEDNAGSPGAVVASVVQSVTGIATGDLTLDVSDVVLKAGESYWLVVRTDAIYKNSFAAGVTSLTLSLNGSGIRRDLEGFALDLRLRITSGTAASTLIGYGVFYEPSIGQVQGGIIKKDVKNFRTTDNLNSFTIGYIADPDLLKIYHVETGQVYHFPSFAISGQTITFPVNTFASILDEPVTLVFMQIEGTSFDNSDINAALLAANHLGSEDGAIDRSALGRGIFLRRPDGTLRELTLDDSDNIAIYSV